MNAIHALATTLSTGTPQTAAGLTLVPLLRRMPARLTCPPKSGPRRS